MNSPAIPHDEIRRSEDRSWSFRLVAAITSSDPSADLGELVHTLQVLDDPRVIAPLMHVLEDLDVGEPIRTAAADALYGCTTAETPQQIQDWWASGDQILMRQAVRESERSSSNLIEQIANDPSHSFHID